MKFGKAFAVGLSALLIANSASVLVSAKEDTADKTYDYVALGDSIAAGFGLESTGATLTSDPALYLCDELFEHPIKDAYVTVFGQYLEEMGKQAGYTTTTTNLSSTGYRAEDVAKTILQEGYMGSIAISILEGFLGPGESKHLKPYHEIYNKYLSEAELISIQLGGNDIILDMLAPMGANDNPILKAVSSAMFTILAGFEPETAIEGAKKILENAKDQITYETVAEAATYLTGLRDDSEKYTTASAENVRKVIDAVRTVNSDADIALIGMFNPYGNSLYYDGQVRDMAHVMKNIFVRAAEEACGTKLDIDDTELLPEEELADKSEESSKYAACLQRLSKHVNKATKAHFTKLVSIVSEEISYPLQYLTLGIRMDPNMKSLNEKLQQIAKDTGSTYVDIYNISNENNLDPHPDPNGHKQIADIMKKTLSNQIMTSMTGTNVQPAEEVTRTSVNISLKQSCQLSGAIAPFLGFQSIEWKTSNENIATVDKNGVVTAKKAGIVTITATAANGKKVTVRVNIKKPSNKSTASAWNPLQQLMQNLGLSVR